MDYFVQVKKWVREINVISLLLVALAVVIEILFGSTVPFFRGVVGNLTTLISSLGDNGLVGLIALGIIVFLFNRKRTTE